MGVTVPNTWASKVESCSQYRIYNAGVQRVICKSNEGKLWLLKQKILRKGIIIGTMPSMYTREAKLNANERDFSAGVGGIKIIASGRGNSFLVQFMRALKSNYERTRDTTDQAKAKTKMYINEIPLKYPLEDELLLNQNWMIFSENIEKLVNNALEQGKGDIYKVLKSTRSIFLM